jgi:uncharacterized phage protein (TIGR02220 family)
MAAIPYMQFYIADYMADTQGLTTIEHGAYLLLIMNYYQTGKSLVDNDQVLARFCRTSVQKWLRLKPMLKNFFSIEGGKWYHKRIEEDFNRIAEKSLKSRDAALSRWSKERENSTNEKYANAMRTQCERNASAMPEEKRREEKRREEINIMSGKPDDTSFFPKSEPDTKTIRNRELKNQAREVLEFLNFKTGKKFRLESDVNLKMVMARLSSGAPVGKCKQIIAKKTREWKDDEVMSKYLRPATLFNATKFEQYLGELVIIPDEVKNVR